MAWTIAHTQPNNPQVTIPRASTTPQCSDGGAGYKAAAAAAQEVIAAKAAAKIEMEKEMERERLVAERAQAIKLQAQQVEATRIEAARKDEIARQERERLAKKEELELDAELQMIDAADAHEEEEDLDALLAEDELVDRRAGGGEMSGRKDDEVSLEDAGDEEDW